MAIVKDTTRNRILLRLLIVGALMGFLGFLAWRNWFQTYHFAAVQNDVLYRDGVRSGREFETACLRSHAKYVVSLVTAQETLEKPFIQEFDYCRRSKIKQINLPIPLGGWPTTEDVQFFLKVATNPKCQPVLVHCAQGVRRTGMMVAAYQMSVLKWDKDKTRSAILAFGHSKRTYGDILTFINQYDPETQTITGTFPKGSE